MADKDNVYGRAIALIREGKVQEADNLLSQAQSEAEPEAVSSPPTPPRLPNQILRDFAGEIVVHLGSPVGLKRLLDEYDRAVARAGEASPEGK
jgi:hypothetical protein